MVQGILLNQEDGKKAGMLNPGAPNPGSTLSFGVKVLTPIKGYTLGLYWGYIRL